jgi:Fe-S cluster assembly ATP-binding protein
MTLTTIVKSPLLQIKDLRVSVNNKEILKGLNLTIEEGEIHAVMGPNGSGKSTLSKVLAGHPSYEVTAGEAIYTDKRGQTLNLLDVETHERALHGLFMAFQYPIEVPGLPNDEFLRAAYNAGRRFEDRDELDPYDFAELLAEKATRLKIGLPMLSRHLNTDLSGGEKKRNEMLQMAILDPRLALLDETDSGLDVDSLRIVTEGINALKRNDNAMVLITHYHRILDYVKPDKVHILVDGRIVETGDAELAMRIEKRGFDGYLSGE